MLAFAAIGGGMMALRIVLHGEIWHERTYWLTGIATMCGLLAAGLSRLALGWSMARAPFFRRHARVLASLMFGTLFVALAALAFLFHVMLVREQVEPNEGRGLVIWLLIIVETTGFGVISWQVYLLPWVLPVHMALAAWLIPPAPDDARD